ncbi:hypothetical protein Plhal304r1_c014g0052951 [Plasmopara halstedii]
MPTYINILAFYLLFLIYTQMTRRSPEKSATLEADYLRTNSHVFSDEYGLCDSLNPTLNPHCGGKKPEPLTDGRSPCPNYSPHRIPSLRLKML